jgi:hypothetical protein
MRKFDLDYTKQQEEWFDLIQAFISNPSYENRNAMQKHWWTIANVSCSVNASALCSGCPFLGDPAKDVTESCVVGNGNGTESSLHLRCVEYMATMRALWPDLEYWKTH